MIVTLVLVLNGSQQGKNRNKPVGWKTMCKQQKKKTQKQRVVEIEDLWTCNQCGFDTQNENDLKKHHEYPYAKCPILQ